MDKEGMPYIYIYIYTVEYLLPSHKKDNILSFTATWTDLEGIMLSEISQIKENIVWFYLYVKSTKQHKGRNKTDS